MRRRLFEIIEVSSDNDRASAVYDIAMLAAIVISVIPLALKGTYKVFAVTDMVTTILIMW